MGVVYPHNFSEITTNAVMHADLCEEDKLLPFKGVIFQQISQYQRCSHFRITEMDVGMMIMAIMVMMMMIHAYTYHYLGRLVGRLDFLGSCSFYEIRHYSGSLVLKKEIHIWKSITFFYCLFQI